MRECGRDRIERESGTRVKYCVGVCCTIAGKFGCFVRVLETTRTEVGARPSGSRHIRKRRIRRHVAWLPYVLLQHTSKTFLSQFELPAWFFHSLAAILSQISDYDAPFFLASGKEEKGIIYRWYQPARERVMKLATRKSTSRGETIGLLVFSTSPNPPRGAI